MSFRQYLERLRRFVSGRRPERQRPTRRPSAEPLEDRTLLSVTFTPGPYKVPFQTRTDAQLGIFSGAAPIEPTLSINPTDPGNLAVSSHDGLQLTTNAGGAFTSTVFYPLPPQDFFSFGDTATTFDGAGRLYWSNLSAGFVGDGVAVAQINPAGGNTISSVLADSDTNFDDKEWIAADASPTSPYSGNVYVVWTNFLNNNNGQIFVAHSTDHGLTWSTPIQLSDDTTEGVVQQSTVAVAPNGDVYVAYHSQPGFGAAGGPDNLANPDGISGQTFILRSTDGGNTFPQKVAAFGPGASDITWNRVEAPTGAIPGAQFLTQGSIQPYIVADPFTPGKIYLATADDPSNGAGPDISDIVLGTSTDFGKTWTSQTLATGGPPGTFRFFPNLTSDQWGDLVVTYLSNKRDQLNASNDYLLDLYAKYSTDGGQTWSPEFLVNNPADPFDPDPGAVERFPGPPPTTRIGEYHGTVLFGGTAYAAWNGNSFDSFGNPVGQQVDFNAIPINGKLTVNGDDAGANTNDNIVISGIAGNPGFFQVLVNGQRQYAGLVSALSGGIQVNSGGGHDTLTIDFANGVSPIPTGGINWVAPAGSPALNLLNLQGTTPFTNETFTPGAVGSGTFTFDNGGLPLGRLTFANITTLDDTAGVTSATFNATAGKADSITLTDQPALIDNSLATQVSVVPAGSPSGFVFNLANKATLTINGAGGGDTFTVNNPHPGDGITALQLTAGGTQATVFNLQVVAVPTTALGGSGNDTFNVHDAANTLNGITADLTLTGNGGTADTVNAIDDADFTLTNALLTAKPQVGAQVTVNLNQVQVANLTGGAGPNTFDVSGWTGTGSLTGVGNNDTVAATKDANFTLANGGLSSSDKMSLTLSGIGTANLTGGAGLNTFNVGGWTGTGTLTGVNNNDTVAAAKNADITLANGVLTSSDGMNLTLSALINAALTDVGNGHTFDVGGWTHTASLTGGSLAGDTVKAVQDTSYTLADALLTATDGLHATLSGIGTANLAGGGGNNSFDVSGWTGGGSLNGVGGVDTLIASGDTNFTLGDAALTRKGGTLLKTTTLALASIEVANLKGGGGANTFDVSGWSGTGTLTGNGGSDVVAATKDADFTLSNTTLSSTDHMSMTLVGIGSAALTAAGNDDFDVSAWTQGGTLAGAGGSDTVTASKPTNFTLSDTSLATSDGMSLTLSQVRNASLTGGTGDDSFNLAGWTGGGALATGGGNDTVSVAGNADFTLADTRLSSNDGLSVGLTGFAIARLTATGDNNLDVSGWTGNGTLTGLGNDVVSATKDFDFTLTDGALASTDGMSVTLAGTGIRTARLTGGNSGNNFDVSGWTGAGALNGLGGADTVTAADNVDFSLGNAVLGRSGLPALGLLNIENANLTNTGPASHAFDVSTWTGGGSLTSGTPGDTVRAVKDASFSFSNNGLSSSDGMNLALSNFKSVALTATGSDNHLFTVGVYSGAATLNGGSGTDTITATKNFNITLADGLLKSSDGTVLTLNNIRIANLTGGAGANTFDVSGWTGGGTLDGQGGTDTVVAHDDVDFTLTNGALVRSGLPTMTLVSMEAADLETPGPTTHAFDVSGWTGTGTLAGGSGNDTVTAGRDTSFTLSNTALSSTDNMSLKLAGFTTANLAGGPGDNNFDVSGWTHTGTLTANGGSDSVTASKNADFTLTNLGLTTTDGMALTLNGLASAVLTAQGNNAFDVIGWTGGGTLTGLGSDTVTAVKDADFALSSTALSSSDGMGLTLKTIARVNLSNGPTHGLFAIGVFSGTGSLINTADDGVVTVTKDSNITLTDALLQSTDGTSFALSGITTAELTGGAGANRFDISGWTHGGSVDGKAALDTIIAAGNTDFSLGNTGLGRAGLPTFALANVENAILTNTGPAAHTFDVSGWTGTGTLKGAGGDTLNATRNTSFTLGNTALSSSDNMSLALSGFTTANLAGGLGANNFDVSGWTHGGSLAGNGGSDTVTASKEGGFTLTDAGLVTTDGMSLGLSGIGAANLTGGVGPAQFVVSGWTGGGALTGGAGGAAVVATKDNNFALGDTGLSSTDGMNFALAGVGTANLTAGPGNHLFTVTNWSGGGSLTGTGGGSDTVTATKDANFTLADNLLSASDPLSLALSGIRTANLVGGNGNNTFNVSGWTGAGSIDGRGGINTVVAGDGTDFSLSATRLGRSGLPTLGLANVQGAQLTDTAGNHGFAITDFSGKVTLAGGGGTDTVSVTRTANFTLANSGVTTSDGLTVTLSGGGITVADLTGGVGNTFDVSGWTHAGALAGGGSDTVIAGRDTNFTLANAALTTSDGMNLGLSGFTTALLTGGAGANSFDVSGWTGGGTLDGQGGSNTVVAADDTSFVLGNSSLGRSGLPNLGLANIGVARLTGGAGNNTFDVSGWTGTGSLDGGGAGRDTVAATKNADFTLSDGNLTTTDGMSLTLNNLAGANLAGKNGPHAYDVGGWTGTGSLAGSGSDTVTATKDADFTLADSGLQAGDGMALGLAGITTADLTSGPGAHTVTVSSWTGQGSLTATGNNGTVAAIKNTDFTLANSSLKASDGLALLLSGFTAADLNGGPGANTFTVSAWTGTGTLTGDATDTVIAVKDTNFTLSDTALSTGDRMSLTLSGIGNANLTGGHSANTFDVGGWTGKGVLTGGGGDDTVTATHDTSFSLGATALSATDGLNLTLSAIGTALLTGGAGNNNFAVGNWAGAVSLTGGGGTDTVSVTRDTNFTLTNAALTTSDKLAVGLSAISAADLTGGPGNNTFDLSGWKGGGALVGNGGSDTVNVIRDTSYTLSNTRLSTPPADGLDMALSGFTTANLTGGAGDNNFDVGGWTGKGTLNGGSGGHDSVSGTKDADFTLSPAALVGSDGMNLTLKSVGAANLTAGPGPDTFNVSAWAGTGSLTGLGTTETVVATKDANFTLSDTGLSSGDGMALALSGLSTANLTAGPGDRSFDVGGWTGTGSITGGGGNDTVTATHDTNFTLADASLKGSDGLGLALAGIGTANLAGGAGANAFDVSGWSGRGGVTGGGGSDTVVAHDDGDFALSNTALARGGRPTLALQGIAAANLAGGPSDNTFDVSGWTGSGLLAGGGGNDRALVTRDASFGLTDTTLGDSAGLNMGLVGVPTVFLTGGPSGNSFSVSQWGGSAFLTGGTGANSYSVAFRGSGNGSVTIADSGASGASGLTVTGTSQGNTITVTGSQISRAGEVVTFSGLASEAIHGGGGANAITFNSTPGARLNLSVDGGPSGSNSLSVIDQTGLGVVHGSLASGRADVHYVDGSESRISFANVQALTLVPGADQSYVQSLFFDTAGRAGSPGEVQALVGLLNSRKGGRAKVVKKLELSADGRLHTVQKWFQQYLGGQVGPFFEAALAAQLKHQSEEQVLSHILSSIYGPVTGSKTAFLEALGQALFGRALTAGELHKYGRAFRGGRPAAALALLKSSAYRTRLVATYVRQLFRIPAGQPLSAAQQALVSQLSGGKLDQRRIRILLETTQDFYLNG